MKEIWIASTLYYSFLPDDLEPYQEWEWRSKFSGCFSVSKQSLTNWECHVTVSVSIKTPPFCVVFCQFLLTYWPLSCRSIFAKLMLKSMNFQSIFGLVEKRGSLSWSTHCIWAELTAVAFVVSSGYSDWFDHLGWGRVGRGSVLW